MNAENRAVPVDDEHVVVTIGYSTPTPWETPRERTEPEIAEEIEKVIAEVPDPSRAVFNFHCPPLDSSLDTCLKLDASVWPPTPVLENKQPVYYGAGSQAVADALDRYQQPSGSTVTSTNRGGWRGSDARPRSIPGATRRGGVARAPCHDQGWRA